jgi:hypothetical protein
MKHRLLTLLVSALCATAQPQQKKATPPAPLTQQLPAAERQRLWRQDLEFFRAHFAHGSCTPADFIREPLLVLQPCHQADFDKLYPEPAFSNEIHAIEESIATLTDQQVILRLARLVATGHVGHTYVAVPILRYGFSLMPFGFRWYADGLAITQASPAYTDALGARVLRIGSLSAEEAMNKVAPYISYENQNWLRTSSTGYLIRMQVLQEIGAADANGNAVLTLAKAGGEPYTLSVRSRDPRVKVVDAYSALKIPETLARKHPENPFYWFEYLPDSLALYIQFDQCENDPKHPFSKFTDELFAFVDSHRVERAIVDLRFNGGGNSRVIIPLKSGLRSRHLPTFVLIGDGTFSSAQDNAIEMRNQNDATLVGAATGEKPNGYGEVRTLTLPNSGIHVQYSTEYFRLIKESDPDALYPDIEARSTIADFLAGRDPALEAALHTGGTGDRSSSHAKAVPNKKNR